MSTADFVIVMVLCGAFIACWVRSGYGAAALREIQREQEPIRTMVREDRIRHIAAEKFGQMNEYRRPGCVPVWMTSDSIDPLYAARNDSVRCRNCKRFMGSGKNAHGEIVPTPKGFGYCEINGVVSAKSACIQFTKQGG